MKPDAERKIVIRGQVFLYQQKAPFVASGESVLGALEYDEDEDKVKCHECGGWFKSVGNHAYAAHDISAREYKRKHGLRQLTGLISEGERSRRIERGRRGSSEALLEGARRAMEKARRIALTSRRNSSGMRADGYINGTKTVETRNIDGRCHAQLLARLRGLADRLGHSPSESQIKEDGISPASLFAVFNVRRLSDVMSLAGLAPNKQGGIPPWDPRQWNKPLLIEVLRDFYVKHKRLPSGSDQRRGMIPSHRTFQKIFGSMPKAYEAAGLGDLAKRGRYLAGARAWVTRRAKSPESLVGMRAD